MITVPFPKEIFKDYAVRNICRTVVNDWTIHTRSQAGQYLVQVTSPSGASRHKLFPTMKEAALAHSRYVAWASKQQ